MQHQGTFILSAYIFMSSSIASNFEIQTPVSTHWKSALLSWNIFANVYRIDEINIFLDKNVSTLNDCIVHLTSTCIILCILICLCTGHWNIKQIVSSYLFVIVQHLSFNNREVIMVCFTFLCLIDFYIFDCVEHNS